MVKLADFEQPHNLEAERALLGSLMLDSDLYTTVSSYIHRDTFYNTTHQYIFEAISTLFTAQEPIDTISIMARLKALGHETELSYVANLPDTVPLSSNIDYYAGIVSSDSKARKVMRKLIEGLNTVVMPGMTSESIDEIIFSVTSELLALTQITDGKGLLPVLEVHDKIEADIERKFYERLSNPDKPSIGGLHSGLVDLDALTNGFAPTEITILAARPSMGKTAASLKMATSCASIDKKPVAYFSVESGKDSIMYRIQSMLSGIDSRRLKNGQMTDDDFKRLAYAKGVISEMPLWIDDKGGASPNYIRNQIQRYNMTHPEPIALVVIDYLQIMNDDAKGKDFNRNNEVGRISKALKEIAKDFNCHIVILSQLSRAIEGRKDNKPVLSDLRESGNIEQDADIVMFIHRDSYYDRSLPDKTSAKIIVAKNRDGACDEVEVSFEAGTTLFGNLQSSVNSIIGGGR